MLEKSLALLILCTFSAAGEVHAADDARLCKENDSYFGRELRCATKDGKEECRCYRSPIRVSSGYKFETPELVREDNRTFRLEILEETAVSLATGDVLSVANAGPTLSLAKTRESKVGATRKFFDHDPMSQVVFWRFQAPTNPEAISDVFGYTIGLRGVATIEEGARLSIAAFIDGMPSVFDAKGPFDDDLYYRLHVPVANAASMQISKAERTLISNLQVDVLARVVRESAEAEVNADISAFEVSAIRPRSNVAVVQRGLTILGFFSGEQNGALGNDTRRAVEKFQSDAGREAHGVLIFEDELLLLEKCAEHGDSSCHLHAGRMHMAPDNPARNVEKGIDQISKAAAQDNAEAHFILGMIHQDGADVPKSIERAREHYQKAAALGHEGAAKALEELEESSPEQH